MLYVLNFACSDVDCEAPEGLTCEEVSDGG